MKTYLLIHGSWHGAWCWEKVVPLLSQEDNKVITLDLPGHGSDNTPPLKISLQSYVDCICRVIDAQAEPLILVGHSMGGIAISQAAEYRSEKIKALIFLSGFWLQDGETLLDVAGKDKDALVLPNLVLDESQGISSIRKNVVREIFYSDCSDEDVARAIPRLRAEPLAPLATPMKISSQNFYRIRQIYIECLRDKAISPAIQKQMYSSMPCQKVISMDTTHSPFFSAPEELARHLLGV